MELEAAPLIALVLAAGISCQWLAWRMNLPAILPLLATGLLLGPVGLDLFHPQEQLGALFFPIVSLSVALILFEGALTLTWREVRSVAAVVRNLLTIGALVTWLGAAVSTHWIMGMRWDLALLFGALIVVTGPTVIAPLLRNVRPTADVSSILKWEAILIDPIGALLAVLIFGVIVSENHGITATALGFLYIVVIGSVLGLLGGSLIYWSVRAYHIPDYLRDVTILAVVMVIFVVANQLAEESGLLAVTVMGLFLANSNLKELREIWYFKEKLSILLISTLFILLAANITPQSLQLLDWRSFLVLAVVLFVLRPLGIFLSTLRSTLSGNERLFLAWIAPRGIVAAAVSSLFAFTLVDLGVDGADVLGPLTFLIIGGTVLLQGSTAKPFAMWLSISEASPQGFLFMGSHRFSQELALFLQAEDFVVRLVDTNWDAVTEARLRGLDAEHGNVLAEFVETYIDLSGIGRLLAMTPNDEANALACQHLRDEFGSSGVYQLSPHAGQVEHASLSQTQLGRLLFAQQASYDTLLAWLEAGAVIKGTPLTDLFGYAEFQREYGERALPLLMFQGKSVVIATADRTLEPRPGWTLVSLVKPVLKSAEPVEHSHSVTVTLG